MINNPELIKQVIDNIKKLSKEDLDEIIAEADKWYNKEVTDTNVDDIENLKTLLFQDNLTQYGKRKLIEYYEEKIKELDIDLTTVYIKGVEDEKIKIKNKIKELKNLIDKIKDDEEYNHEIPLYEHDIQLLQELLGESEDKQCYKE